MRPWHSSRETTHIVGSETVAGTASALLSGKIAIDFGLLLNAVPQLLGTNPFYSRRQRNIVLTEGQMRTWETKTQNPTWPWS